MSAAAPQLAELRALLQQRFPTAHAHALGRMEKAEPQSIQSIGLDAIRPAPGTITEIVGTQPSCGTGIVLNGLLDRGLRQHQWMALVDGRDSFEPCTLPQELLPFLLWVRCKDLGQALRCTDLLLRDGNFPMVLLDLQLNPPVDLQRTPGSLWHRLRLVAAESLVTLVAITPCKAIPSAQARFTLSQNTTLASLDLPLDEALTGLQPRCSLQRSSLHG